MVYEKDKIDFRILGDSNYKLIKGLQQDIYTRNWNEGEIEHLLKKGGGQGLIIYLSKKPIGYCFFRNLVDEAEILSLEIKSKYRNKGFGLLLFKKVELYFADKKICKCFLEVNKNNNLAINVSYEDGLLLKKTYI